MVDSVPPQSAVYSAKALGRALCAATQREPNVERDSEQPAWVAWGEPLTSGAVRISSDLTSGIVAPRLVAVSDIYVVGLPHPRLELP